MAKFRRSKPMPTPLDRFFEAAGCGTQVELADFFRNKVIVNGRCKEEGEHPSDWLITLWRKKGVEEENARRKRPVGVQVLDSVVLT